MNLQVLVFTTFMKSVNISSFTVLDSGLTFQNSRGVSESDSN